ncbi:glycosyltransferase family 2 protein [Patescibacteria group bacterium]|nr:glycosyltransferase family 2 protein [Patescibacteria group bacterium]MCG2701762.1 glycosyltransferase family 2 protein [Candidatus Parcubacteria bacterium]MBU4264667.1 glycosyltransferase family 2 protein [Patescibacteria group bacterium]MBU4390622.1 glycosyltransferase family 2 protein [Patescibacteria group bacterium]MBU4396637.1 glycosyltransferase family 2 protein [Patescibacteria group bacterium]
MKFNIKKISFVIPLYNEEESLKQLHKEIVAVVKKLKFDYEIIFINDGSTDNTQKELEKLDNVKIVTLRRSYGQTAGIDAGIKNSKGDVIVTMDGDGQNNPADVPKLIKKLQRWDVVVGWRKRRKDPTLKKFFSFGARKLRKIIFKDGIHDAGCGLKVFKRECFDNLDLYGEMHRFIHIILKSRGFKVTEVIVDHRPRLKGKTKYNWTRTIKSLVDMLTILFWRRFANRPLHVFGTFGFLLTTVGIFGIVGIVVNHFLFFNLPYETMLLVIFSTIVLAGIQLFVSGIITDICVKNFFSTSSERPYYISSIKSKT